MNVSEWKSRDPWRLGSILNGQAVHLYIPLPYRQQTTACRKVLYEDGFTGQPEERHLCRRCLKSIGMTCETIRRRTDK